MMANNNATTSTSTPQPQQPKSSTDGSNNSFIAYKPSYVLTETEIHRRLSEVVNELQETIRIPAAICQRLLQQARWDHDQAVLNFFANDGKLEPALYGAYDPADPTEDDPVKKFSLASGHCELCDADDIPLRALNCRHFFCIDCWCHFLKTKVMDETTIQITCPAFDCNVLLDRTTALQMITVPEMHRLYTRLEVKNYLMSNRVEMQQCPSTGCPNIVQSSMIQSRRYTCSCGTIFCSECGNPWHEPINCELLRLWLKRCDDDLGSLAWIRRFTKPCPRCETPIEKNRGCNHITCRGCRYQFCWVCLGAWSLHSRDQFFACNRFNGNAPNANNNNRPDPDAPQGNRPPERTELDRFFFYATRYENHARSQLLERQQFRQQSKGWRQAYQDRTGQHESNFLPAAIDALAWARLLLQFSYPFAYFLNRLYDTSRHFEDRQKQLETGVEQLSALLEQGNNIGGSPGMEMDALTKLKTELTKVTRQLKRDGVLLLRYAYQSEWHFSAELAPGLESGIMPEQERETSNDADDDDEATTSADVRKKTHEMEGTATSSQAGNSSHDEGIDLEEFDFAP